ncbi:MAG: hypothetical protein JO256_08095, partial [Alphaproteobacteria bacterium]|nr:hypothetical protein [Alphaproteobacteria bacterium]
MIASLPPPLSALAFAFVFTVSFLALTGFRSWLARQPRESRKVFLPFGLLALIAVLLATGGAVGLSTTGKSFVTLGAMVTGCVSLAVLGDLLWRWLSGRSIHDRDEKLDVVL